MLTEDEIRNNSIADLLEEEAERIETEWKEIVIALDEKIQKKTLYELFEMQKIMSKVLSETFRSKLVKLSNGSSEIQQYQTKERMKRLIALLRTRSEELIHPFDDYQFSDKVRKKDVWENSPIFRQNDLSLCVGLLTSRLSEIHYNIFKLTEKFTFYIITEPQTLNNFQHSKYNDTIRRIGHYLEVCRSIQKELFDYYHFINNL